MDHYVDMLNSSIDSRMANVMDNHYFILFLEVLLVVYVILVVPRMPPGLVNLLDNPYVTVIGLALVIYSYNKNATLSILLAIALVMTLHVVSKYRMLEDMAYPYNPHDRVDRDHYSPAD